MGPGLLLSSCHTGKASAANIFRLQIGGRREEKELLAITYGNIVLKLYCTGILVHGMLTFLEAEAQYKNKQPVHPGNCCFVYKKALLAI